MPGGGGDVVGDGSKAGGDAPDNPASPPGDLGPIIAANNAGQPPPPPDVPDVPDGPPDPTQIAKGDGSKDPNAPQSDAGQGGTSDALKNYQDQIKAKHPDWDDARVKNSAEKAQKLVADSDAKAKSDPEYSAILDHQRELKAKDGLTDISLTVQAILEANKAWNKNRQEDKQQADAANAAADAKNKQDQAAQDDQKYRQSQEYQDYVASKWSDGYDKQEKAWQQNNLTSVGGKLLTPDEVAALNAENEKTYKNNRTNDQIEDDTYEAGGFPRDHGTQGFKPIPVTTNGQPRPVKPDGYKPPNQRTKVVRAGYE